MKCTGNPPNLIDFFRWHDWWTVTNLFTCHVHVHVHVQRAKIKTTVHWTLANGKWQMAVVRAFKVIVTMAIAIFSYFKCIGRCFSWHTKNEPIKNRFCYKMEIFEMFDRNVDWNILLKWMQLYSSHSCLFYIYFRYYNRNVSIAHAI